MQRALWHTSWTSCTPEHTATHILRKTVIHWWPWPGHDEGTVQPDGHVSVFISVTSLFFLLSRVLHWKFLIVYHVPLIISSDSNHLNFCNYQWLWFYSANYADLWPQTRAFIFRFALEEIRIFPKTKVVGQKSDFSPKLRDKVDKILKRKALVQGLDKQVCVPKTSNSFIIRNNLRLDWT